jgi:hypothetical protein
LDGLALLGQVNLLRRSLSKAFFVAISMTGRRVAVAHVGGDTAGRDITKTVTATPADREATIMPAVS